MNSEKPINEVIERVIDRIKEVRKEKGYSLENMADGLQLSVSAYNKIENQETKLTFERFLQIQRFLEVPVNKLFDIHSEKVFNQNIHPNGVGYIEHLYRENKAHVDLLLKNYENLIKAKDELIESLKNRK